ncbi:MAG: hypothetical protein ACOY4W_03425 [Thermodesulfobacteriota bacterium]
MSYRAMAARKTGLAGNRPYSLQGEYIKIRHIVAANACTHHYHPVLLTSPGRHFIPQDDMPSFLPSCPCRFFRQIKKYFSYQAVARHPRSTTQLAHFMQFVFIMFSPGGKCIPCRAWEPSGIAMPA